MRVVALIVFLALFRAASAAEWEHWGSDAAGTRFSPASQITPANIDNLVRAWEYRTGDLGRQAARQQ